MKLYYSKGACSFAVRIILNELGIKADYVSVDLATKKLENGADFLKINPKGAVPVIEIIPGEVLTENAIILQYLADTNNASKLLPTLGMERYRMLECLNFITTELHKGFAPLFNKNMPQPVLQDIIIPNVKNKLKLLEDKLGDNKFLFGDNFTLADAYLFVILMWSSAKKIGLDSYPNLSRYYANLMKRDSVKKALQEEQLAVTA